MEAYNLQQELSSQFGLSILLEERIDDCFSVVLNGTTLYKKETVNDSHIDHQKIISSVGRYTRPLVKNPEVQPAPDDNNDPDHLQWMNSVCSGE